MNWQAERFAREGVPSILSPIAYQVGAATAALMLLNPRIEAPFQVAELVDGDDSTSCAH